MHLKTGHLLEAIFRSNLNRFKKKRHEVWKRKRISCNLRVCTTLYLFLFRSYDQKRELLCCTKKNIFDPVSKLSLSLTRFFPLVVIKNECFSLKKFGLKMGPSPYPENDRKSRSGSPFQDELQYMSKKSGANNVASR